MGICEFLKASPGCIPACGHITLLIEQPGLLECVPASGDWRKNMRLELNIYNPFQPKPLNGSVIIVGSICCQLLPFPKEMLHYT